MKANLLDKMLERAEELGWCYRKEEQESPLGNGQVDRYIEFERYTPAGEDFLFTVFYEKPEYLPREIMSYADDFDLNDHVLRWLDAKRNGDSTVPDVVELVDDGRWIQNELKILAEELNREMIRLKEIERTGGLNA